MTELDRIKKKYAKLEKKHGKAVVTLTKASQAALQVPELTATANAIGAEMTSLKAMIEAGSQVTGVVQLPQPEVAISPERKAASEKIETPSFLGKKL